MLCQSCQVIFPFYLSYCRKCGEKLIKEKAKKSHTTQMASLVKRAEIGKKVKAEYVTAPITQQMGQAQRSVAEKLQNILDEFPSLETTKISQIFLPAYIRKMSHSEQMRQTLREFDMSELEYLERNSGILSNNNNYPAEHKTNDNGTLEFKRPSAHLGETLPFASSNSSYTGTINQLFNNKTKYVLGSDRLGQTRPLPAKLHLPTSQPLIVPTPSSSGIALSFKQTLNNLWFRMRDLAENLAVNFSIKKSA